MQLVLLCISIEGVMGIRKFEIYHCGSVLALYPCIMIIVGSLCNCAAVLVLWYCKLLILMSARHDLIIKPACLSLEDVGTIQLKI